MTAGGYDPNQYPQGQQPYGQGGYPQGQQPYPQGGFPPPGPPPHGGPGGPGAPGSFSVGDAFNYALNKFKANPGPWIALTALAAVPALIQLIGSVAKSSALISIGGLLGLVAGIVVVNLATGGALREADGVKLTFDNMFQFRNIGNSIAAYFITVIGVTIGSCFCFIPGFLVATLLMFGQYFIIEHNQDAITGLKSSFELVKANFGDYAVLALAALGILLAGFIVCGVGLLVAAPIASLMIAYAFRRSTGGVTV